MVHGPRIQCPDCFTAHGRFVCEHLDRDHVDECLHELDGSEIDENKAGAIVEVAQLLPSLETPRPLSPMRRKALDVLVGAYPASVPMPVLLAGIYPGRTRRPPNARVVVLEQVKHLRSSLNGIGWTIPRNPRTRGRLAQYRLSPLPDEGGRP